VVSAALQTVGSSENKALIVTGISGKHGVNV